MTVRVRVDKPLVAGEAACVDSGTSHHLTHVLRLSPGASVEVVDGQGRLFEAVVAPGDGGAVTVVLGVEVVGPSANPRVPLTVWLPLLKGGKTDDLVRQLTEVGVTRIVPFVSRHSVVKLDIAKAAKRERRWQTIADEATRQCRRTDRVVVSPVARALPATGPGVFFYAAGAAPLNMAVLEAALAGDGGLEILVGPEGGLSSQEAQQLGHAGWVEAWLGPRILRAETAVVAASILVMQVLGEYRAAD